jgi:hypothetical protein
MSYDIEMVDLNGKVVTFADKHDLRGGTYALGGTPDAHLNMTYNYSTILYAKLGEKGIRTIYGMTAAESIPVLKDAISRLNRSDVHPDYWQATEGNVAAALQNFVYLAEMVHDVDPTAIWAGD